jgi:hypothetical protein
VGVIEAAPPPSTFMYLKLVGSGSEYLSKHVKESLEAANDTCGYGVSA